jgi:hypothetical protein
MRQRIKWWRKGNQHKWETNISHWVIASGAHFRRIGAPDGRQSRLRRRMFAAVSGGAER